MNNRTLRAVAATLAATTLFLFSAIAQAGELVVVVSARSQVEAMRPDQVAAIFLGQSARLPDGTVATPIDQLIGSSQRDGFYQRVTGKTPRRV